MLVVRNSKEGSTGIRIEDIEFGSCFLYGGSLDIWMKIAAPEDDAYEEYMDEEAEYVVFAVNLTFGITRPIKAGELVQPVEAHVVIETYIPQTKKDSTNG